MMVDSLDALRALASYIRDASADGQMPRYRKCAVIGTEGCGCTCSRRIGRRLPGTALSAGLQLAERPTRQSPWPGRWAAMSLQLKDCEQGIIFFRCS